MELINSLDFVHVEDEGDTKEEIIANLEQGFKEIKAIQEGKNGSHTTSKIFIKFKSITFPFPLSPSTNTSDFLPDLGFGFRNEWYNKYCH